MAAAPGHRAGMAIVRVELERPDGERVLVRITTVDDVTVRETLPEGRPFGDVDEAFAYLRTWLDGWLSRT